jgi:hypothetical protein
MASAIPNQGQQQGQNAQMGQPIGGQAPGAGVPKSQQGTGYTNLSTIMGANQGNQLGQAVAGGIENTGKQATNALQSGQQNFQQQSQANALGTQAQQQYVQNTLGNLGVGANGQSTNPTSVTAPSAGDVSNFQQYMAGQYAGPTNIANIGAIQNQAANAQQQGQEVGSAGGRQALLQQYASNPGTAYGSGAQNLDTALLGATGGTQLQQARQAVSGLNNQVSSAQSAAQQQAQQLQNQAQGFGQAVTGQVTGAAQNVYGAANQQAQNANTANTAAQNAEQTAAMNAQLGNYNQATLSGLGLTAGQATLGLNVGQYLGYNPQNEQATALNVMGQPQYQQYSGLNQLLGQTTGPQGTAYQAGNTTYNTAGLDSALQANSNQLTAASQAANDAAAHYQAALHGSGDPLAGTFAKQEAYQQMQQAEAAYTQLQQQMAGNANLIPG